MALFDDLSDGVKKAFLAGVGAVAIGAEKSQELVDELIRKGEVTVEQGKTLNEELTRKVKEAVKETTDGASDEMLRAKLRNMTAEKRLYELGANLGELLCAVLFAYDPSHIAFGGGVAYNYPYFRKAMEEYVKKNFPYHNTVDRLKIDVFTGGDVLVTGAALI